MCNGQNTNLTTFTTYLQSLNIRQPRNLPPPAPADVIFAEHSMVCL